MFNGFVIRTAKSAIGTHVLIFIQAFVHSLPQLSFYITLGWAVYCQGGYIEKDKQIYYILRNEPFSAKMLSGVKVFKSNLKASLE